jgi:hypothetical protein
MPQAGDSPDNAILLSSPSTPSSHYDSDGLDDADLISPPMSSPPSKEKGKGRSDDNENIYDSESSDGCQRQGTPTPVNRQTRRGDMEQSQDIGSGTGKGKEVNTGVEESDEHYDSDGLTESQWRQLVP